MYGALVCSVINHWPVHQVNMGTMQICICKQFLQDSRINSKNCYLKIGSNRM